MITIDELIDEELVEHTKFVTSNGEVLSYYIDKKIGQESLDIYDIDINGNTIKIDTIQTINQGHSIEDSIFINETFIKIDKIIDLDFLEMSHNNGSMIDIYHISYSSHFRTDVIGQALTQRTKSGGWWDIFWKDSNLTGEINVKSDHNTIIHEIGHSLGLSHPFNDPKNQEWDSSHTIMSYNRAEDGWDTWFSQNDINALIKIWGREDDDGIINYDKISKDYKFKRDTDSRLFINTDVGLENISQIKRLNFLDKSLDVDKDIISVFNLLSDKNDINSKIYRLYNSCFNRFPDIDGISYWIEQNRSKINTLKQTANSFIISKEFENLYGKDSTNKTYISNLYNNIFDRSPDIEGLNYWLNQLNTQKENRTEVLLGFSESIENKSIFMAETSLV